MTDVTDTKLAAQYEAFPYPQRDPRDEAKRLVIGSPSHLREVDYWVFGGRRSRATPLRALIAGGGTGDGAIMLASQMARDGRPGSVTYLDRSARAMEVAQARAAARGLTNMRWEQRSLLELPEAARSASGFGPFDYIDCCGVLHHLPDPEAGLASLLSVLAPDGGLGLMVYAPHGRTGVYMVQDALAKLAPSNGSPQARLEIAKRVMRHLPESAWLRQNRSFSDHIDGGDAGLYDLLLNPRDRAYDVAAFHALLARAGLRVNALIEPLRYDPLVYLPDPKLRALAAALDPVDRAALAEALTGNMSTHVAYCTREAEALPAADPWDDAAIPLAREMPAPEIARNIRPDGTLAFVFDGLRVPVAVHKLAGPILSLIDDARSVGAMRAALIERGFKPAEIERGWRETFATFSALNRIFLASPA